jgi:hypothetical protein
MSEIINSLVQSVMAGTMKEEIALSMLKKKAEKADFLAQLTIAKAQAKPRKQRVKVALRANMPLENKLVSFDKNGKASVQYVLPTLPFVSPKIDFLAEEFNRYLLKVEQKKSSQIKAWRNRVSQNGCKAMFSLFSAFVENKRILSDEEIAIRWPSETTASFKNHSKKVRRFLETLR